MATRRSGPGQGGGPDDLPDIHIQPLMNAYRRLDRRLQVLVLLVLVVAGLVALFVYWQQQKRAWEQQVRQSQAHLPSATAPATTRWPRTMPVASMVSAGRRTAEELEPSRVSDHVAGLKTNR